MVCGLKRKFQTSKTDKFTDALNNKYASDALNSTIPSTKWATTDLVKTNLLK